MMGRKVKKLFDRPKSKSVLNTIGSSLFHLNDVQLQGKGNTACDRRKSTQLESYDLRNQQITQSESSNEQLLVDSVDSEQ